MNLKQLFPVFQGKLELITGVSAATMEIFVHDEKRGGAVVCSLSDDSALLGSYPVDSGMRLHVKDTSGKASAFDDEMLSKVEKFELSQEQVSSLTICNDFNHTLSLSPCAYFLKASDAGDISPPFFFIFRQILG